MGVLLVAPLSRDCHFTVPFIKETIEWYRTGECDHVVRVFVRPTQSAFTGCRIVIEHPIALVEDHSDVLANTALLGMWKEFKSEALKDQSFQLDDYRYRPIPVALSLEHVGAFGVIALRPLAVLPPWPDDLLIAFVIRAKSRRPYSILRLLLFGQVELETCCLMPPTTVAVDKRRMSASQTLLMNSWEHNQAAVDRYELWVVTEGRFNGCEATTPIETQRSHPISGDSAFERHYNMPPLHHGWEVKLDLLKKQQFYNDSVRFAFRQAVFLTAMSWVFGLATLAGLLLALWSLSRP